MWFFRTVGLIFFAYLIGFLTIFLVGSKSNHLCNGIVVSIICLYYLTMNTLKVIKLKYMYNDNISTMEEAQANEPRMNKFKSVLYMILISAQASLIIAIIITLVRENNNHTMV